MARFFLLALLCCPFGNAFQNVEIVPRTALKPSLELPPAHLRIDTALVLVPVHVTTPFGVSVTDLNRTDFRIFEDNVEQPITQFAKDDAPLSIGLVFDASASMHNKLHKSSEAAAAEPAPPETAVAPAAPAASPVRVEP